MQHLYWKKWKQGQRRLLTGIIFLATAVFLLAACGGKTTATMIPATQALAGTAISELPTMSPEATVYPYPEGQLFPAEPQATAYPQPEAGDAYSPYPQPGEQDNENAPAASPTPTAPAQPSPANPSETPTLLPPTETVYPGPVDIGNEPYSPYPYPGPEGQDTPVPGGQSTPLPGFTPTSPETGATSPAPQTSLEPVQDLLLTQTASITPTPTEFVPAAGITPLPDLGVTLRIWHSWPDKNVQILQQVIRSFQYSQPDVRFDLLYVPENELQKRFVTAAYQGAGPSLVLGNSDWTAALVDSQLVQDLTPYISPAFAETLSPAALDTLRHRGVVAGLPYALYGAVLYRNQALAPQPAQSFDELLQAAKTATASGNVGIYLDWGMYYSGGYLQGLGGRWLDEQGLPAFQDDEYAAALAWLQLLQTVKNTGGVEFNQERATRLFEEGRVGWIVEHSASRYALAQAIGIENLVIDPWPVVAAVLKPDGSQAGLARSGVLSGYVQSEAVFLNANVSERSARELQAALRFMGVLLTSPVQVRLSEAGFIPSLGAAQTLAQPSQEVRDAFIRQAQAAFATGAPYPPAWQGELRQAYWTALDAAAQAVLAGKAPAEALAQVYTEILARCQEILKR